MPRALNKPRASAVPQPALGHGAVLEEGRLPGSCAPSQPTSPCPAGGWLAPSSTLTLKPMQGRCSLQGTATASLPRGCPPSVWQAGGGPSAMAPGAAIALPGCVGTAPGAGACRISLFKRGSWRPAKQRFVLSNILANGVSAAV